MAAKTTMRSKILIFTATYNEADNITDLVRQALANAPDASMLVIDDNSPDGTGAILDRLAGTEKRLIVQHRQGKLGLGTAHLEAMAYAVRENYDLLVTMDADFSHNPRDIANLLKLAETHDFVIGSRYVAGGGLDYGLFRRTISKTANMLARLLLSIRLRECTTSFRAYKKQLLENILKRNINSTGYSFFFEVTFHVTRITKNVTEFPIFFADRTRGESKISKNEIFRGIWTLLTLFLRRISGKID